MFTYKLLIYPNVFNSFSVLYLISAVASETSFLAPVGKSCREDIDCFDDLICVSDKCRCKPKHVQNGIYCFTEAYYGQNCWFDDQCIDHRQVCSNTTDQPRKCICDMYHEYNETLAQCSPKANLTSLLEEKYNTFDEISSHAKKTFYGIFAVGVAVTIVGLFCCIGATVYCIRIYTTDKKLEDDVNALVVKQGGKPSNFSTTRSESQRKRQLGDAAIGPMVNADMILA